MLDHAESEFAQDGRTWLRNAINGNDLTNLRDQMAQNTRPGARIAPTSPIFQTVANLPFNAQIQTTWPGMHPVRMVSFNKTADGNWGVPWHQDRIIAVNARADVEGFSNWSQKQGAWHCEPPQAILEQMLFVRLHLDPSTPANGAMQIAVGSHTHGKVDADHADKVATQHTAETTTANPGDVLIMSMMLLHKSDPAQVAEARQAIRIDYAPCELPDPLRWAAGE